MNKKYISLVVVALLLTACGGSSSSSSSKNDGKGDIDLTEYYPSKSMTKTYSSVERDGDNVDTSHYNEIIEVVGNTITTTVDTKVSENQFFLILILQQHHLMKMVIRYIVHLDMLT